MLKIKTAPCRYGEMSWFDGDVYIGRSLEKYGEYSELEAMCWRKLLKPGDVAVDVGANIGALTLALADIVGSEGRVFAFEPQPDLYELAVQNAGGNDRITVSWKALGREKGITATPLLDQLGHRNYGHVVAGPGQYNPVECSTLDAEAAEARVDFIKIDVEGAELAVLEGARATIERCRPILDVEALSNDQAVPNLLRSLDYRLFEHTPPLFNPANWKGDSENVFGRTVSLNILAIPSERLAELREPLRGMRQLVPAHPNLGKTGWATVCRLGGIGDDLIAASVLKPLHDRGYKIEVISQKPQSVVFQNNPHIDKLVEKERGWFEGDMRQWQAWFAKRGEEVDLLINLSHSMEGLCSLFPASTPFWWPDRMRRAFCNRNFLDVVAEIAGVPFEPSRLFYPTEEEIEQARDVRARAAGERRIIGWCITGTRLDKVYPQSPMAVARLAKEIAHVMLLGGLEKELEMARTIEDHTRNWNGSTAGLNMGGPLPDGNPWPIRRNITFLMGCDLVIAPDTGPAWAVAMEAVPKIMLLSHNSPFNVTEHWVNTTTLHADQSRVPCWPCHRLHDDKSTCHENPTFQGAACISDISVEAIVRAAQLWLDDPDKARATIARPLTSDQLLEALRHV